MKFHPHILAAFWCLFCGACVPGKLASRIDGFVIDSNSSEVVAGARLVSTIPHRDGSTGVVESVEVTDGNGKFSFGPEYGIFKFLTPKVDLREIRVSREGYKQTEISIMHRGGERFVKCRPIGDTAVTLSKGPIRIKLSRETND